MSSKSLHEACTYVKSYSMVFYIMYFPEHLKYVSVDLPTASGPTHIRTTARTNAWATSVILAWVVVIVTYVLEVVLWIGP